MAASGVPPAAAGSSAPPLRLQLISYQGFNQKPPVVKRDATVAELEDALDLASDAGGGSVVCMQLKDPTGTDYFLQVPQEAHWYLRLSKRVQKGMLPVLKKYFRADRFAVEHRTPFVGYTPHEPGDDRSKMKKIPHLKLIYRSFKTAQRQFNFAKTKDGTRKKAVWDGLQRFKIPASALDQNRRTFSAHALCELPNALLDALNTRFKSVSQEDNASIGSWLEFDCAKIRWLPAGQMFARGKYNGFLSSSQAIRRVINTGIPDAPLTIRSFDLETMAGTFDTLDTGQVKTLAAKCGGVSLGDAGKEDEEGGGGGGEKKDGGGGSSAGPTLDVRRFSSPGQPNDAVIQCAVTTCTDAFAAGKMEHTVLCLGDTGAVPGADVQCFKSEAKLILAFIDMLKQGVDVVTGYNIISFDLKYLFMRMALMELCCLMDYRDLRPVWEGAAEKVAKFHKLQDLQDGPNGKNIRRMLHRMFGMRVRNHDHPGTVFSVPEKYLVMAEMPKFNRAVHASYRQLALDAGGLEVVSEFFYMGHYPCERIRYTDRVYSTSAHGQIRLRYWKNTGFTLLCGWLVMLKGQKKLERYTLKFAAQTLFDDDESLRKIDMPYREIFARRDRQMTVEALEKQLQAEDLDAASLLEQLAALQQAQQKSDAEQAKRAGTDTAEAPDPSDNATKATQLDRLRAAFAAAKAKSRAQMGEVAAYCVQDAHLPVRMLDKLQAVTELREKARIFRVPMHVLSFCGMQVIVDGIFDAYFHTHGIIRNTFYSVKYEYPGSFVLKAKHGFFDTPVGTLDFASLYPSIIQAHGLCPTAIPLPEPGAATAETAPLPPGVRAIEVDTTEGIDPADYKKGVEPHVHQVVQNFKGVLPSILETVLGARARIRKVLMAAVYKKVDAAKARLAAAEAANEPTAPFRAEIRSLNGDLATLNGRQLAMKVAANSMYGYFGVRTGSCPCTAIAALTTALGRRALVWTQKAMETAVCMRRTGSTRQEVEDAVAEFRELVSGNRAKRRNPVQPDGASALVRIKCAMRRANTPPALEQAVAAAAERAVRGFRDIWTYDRDRVPAATAAVFQARKILRRLPRRFKQTMLALKHAGLSSRALRAGADALATHAEGKSVHAETAQAAALAVAACAESGLDDRDGAQAAKITAELRRLMADTAPIVIYGDTDSVMVNLGHLRAHAARDEFDWLAEVVSTDVLFKHFPTLVLEAEDQSVMFLLYCDKKKRYIKVIIKWKRVVVSPEDVREDPDHPGSFFTFATAAQDLKLACERVKDKKTGAEVWMAWRIVGFKFTEKGIETKRRDPMPVVKQCAKKAIRLAMPTAPDSEAPVDVSKEATRPQVRAHLAATVAAIVNDELPVHVYAKTQKMRLDYKLGDPAHVVAAKMHNLLVSLGLMDGEMINSGDRTSTVRVFNGDWNAKYVDVAQDPRWVEMHPEKFRVDRVNVLEVLEKVVTRVLPYHFDQRDMKRLFGAARGAVKRQLEGTGDITAALRRKQASSSSGSSGSNSGSSSSGSSNSGSSSGSSSSGSSSSVAATSTAKPRFVPPPFAPGPQFESFESESSGDRFSGEARVQSIAAFLDFGIPAARTPTPTKRRASSGSGGSGGSGGLGGSGGSGGQQKRVRKTATAAAKKKTAKPGGNPFKRKTASTAQAAKKKKRGKAKGKKGPVDAKHSIMRFLKKSK